MPTALMPQLLLLLLVLLLLLLPFGGRSQSELPAAESHEPLKAALRAAMADGAESLDEFAEAASGRSANRRVRKLAGLGHEEFGVRGTARAFNGLKGNSSSSFAPFILGILRVKQALIPEILEAAFAEDTGAEWRAHLLAYPPTKAKSGTKLSCLLSCRNAEGNFDVVVVTSPTAEAKLFDGDYFLMASKTLGQLGRPRQREALVARVDGDAGLTDEDVHAVMARAEAACIRRLAARFHIAFDA